MGEELFPLSFRALREEVFSRTLDMTNLLPAARRRRTRPHPASRKMGEELFLYSFRLSSFRSGMQLFRAMRIISPTLSFRPEGEILNAPSRPPPFTGEGLFGEFFPLPRTRCLAVARHDKSAPGGVSPPDMPPPGLPHNWGRGFLEKSLPCHAQDVSLALDMTRLYTAPGAVSQPEAQSKCIISKGMS
jgi:hypothetical protein